MTGHDVHTGDPRQVLQDHCGECARRAKDVHVAIGHFDPARFAVAWKRAARWQQHGMKGISRNEMPVLLALWAVAVQLEKRGIPVGTVPGEAP